MKNEKLKIEKDIPIPDGFSGKSEIATLMRAMEIGDSVLIPGNTTKISNAAASYIGKVKYRSRKEGDGFRVWRIQ